MSYAQKLRLPQRGSYLLDPTIFLPPSISPILSLLFATLFPSSPASLSVFTHTKEGSSCFCFDDIFSLRIGREKPSPLASRPHSSPPLSINRFDPVCSAQDNPRNLLFGISWIIINAYAVAGGIERPVILLLFLISPPSSPPPPHHSPLLPSVASNTSVRRRTTTVA